VAVMWHFCQYTTVQKQVILSDEQTAFNLY
jgi:hypothetical protein